MTINIISIIILRRVSCNYTHVYSSGLLVAELSEIALFGFHTRWRTSLLLDEVLCVNRAHVYCIVIIHVCQGIYLFDVSFALYNRLQSEVDLVLDTKCYVDGKDLQKLEYTEQVYNICEMPPCMVFTININ